MSDVARRRPCRANSCEHREVRRGTSRLGNRRLAMLSQNHNLCDGVGIGHGRSRRRRLTRRAASRIRDTSDPDRRGRYSRRTAVLGLYVASVARSRSIAARISGTASEQNRSATASNRVAISRGHLTAKGSGPNSLLPRTTPRPSAADSSDGRLQTGELGPGQDDLDHLVPFKRYRERSAASTSNDSANRCVAKSSAARTSRNFSSGVSGGSFTPGQYHELLYRAVANHWKRA
jgi:hypothetical protein